MNECIGNLKKPKVIAVVGPTASGKTAIAVSLAERLNGEVISADSMQIYKYMNIATAKPTEEEMRGIPHHLIDFVEPDEKFSVARYVELAHALISDITARGKVPIIAGGTGLYVDSLLKNIEFSPQQSDDKLREELNALAKEKGGEYMLEMLREIDPETAARLHPNDLGRTIRGIEIYRITGVTMTQQLERSRGEQIYDTMYIGIDLHDREKLYERINKRVDMMLERGLVDELKELVQHGFSATAAQAIGYKELYGWLNGEMSFEQAVEELKRGTRRYAKRQLTWFRKNTDVNWFYREDYSDTTALCNAVGEKAEGFLKQLQ
ncbi:MAG: tRNA (adenosine(37)-N6)-dimethylallyltransferase MiaA [Oscillospiraceae bacterium]|nr:tRNA (adenosine(37)-N6)-dimethylallyltransferase MiaA [Oscillospiraceae bacterium]MBQ3048666.1 tRNA (adenosine(37)-N6)-dimethylallyltransferase MiaA [Oscillospiraceae bacterium]